MREPAKILRISSICWSESPCSCCICWNRISFCCCNVWHEAEKESKRTSPKRTNSPTHKERSTLILRLRLAIRSHYIEEIPVIGVTEKTRDFLARIHFVHLIHSGEKVIDKQLRPYPAVKRR